MPAASPDVSVDSAPPWAARFASHALDEIRNFVSSSDAEHSRAANGSGPLGFEYSWVTSSAYKFQWVRMAVGQTIRAATPAPTLHLIMPPGNRYRVGRREFVPSLGSMMLLAPGWEYTRTGPMGARFGATVSSHCLAREIEVRQSVRRGDPVFRTQLIDLLAPERATLLEAALEVVFDTHPESSLHSRQHAEARLTALIADLILRRGAVPRAQAVSASRIAALESWIDEHLEEPLTIGRLCAVSVVGERSLQKAFHSRRGMSPMRFVAERRLAAARERLTGSAPGRDVTTVAMELGFGHVGRFAQMYRQAFGETPSATLKRVAVRAWNAG